MVVTSAVESAIAELGAAGVDVSTDHALGPLTTYRAGGAAAAFVSARDHAQLVSLATVLSRHPEVPVLVVGRGSNMLVADAGFDGVAVQLGDAFETIELREDVDGDVGTSILVESGGAASLPVVARRTAAAGLHGFEWAVGVPGSLGGAVRMNAGGHGSDMAACLADVEVLDLGALAPVVERRTVESLNLRFRGSDLTDDEVVVAARLRLVPGERAPAEATINEIVRWRREHQPGGQNCGSVFVNPVPGEVSAGSLVDGLALRGFRIGSAWVSEKHANFIQASEGGTAADVRAVIEAVRERVATATGFRLRSEVRLVGFGDDT